MKRIWLGIFCAALLGIGCGDDDNTGSGVDTDGGSAGKTGGSAGKSSGGKDGGSEPGSSDSVEKMITAKSGGKVSTTGATLDIPAGALGKDTKVTVDTVDAANLPDSDMVASTAYDFGPDGTTFEKPVALTIEFTGKAPEGMSAMIAWLDGDKWTALEDSAVEGGSVTASTTHFTTFAVVWTSNGDGTGTQTEGMCPDITSGTTCGGDPTGTWKFTATCVTLPPDFLDQGSDSGLSTCKGVKVAGAIDLSGTVTFNKDKTYEIHSTTSGSVDVSIPKMCLMNAPCPDAWMDSGESCDTSMPIDEKKNDEMGTYEIAGHTLTTTATDDTAGAPSDFCVDGDTITAKVTDPDDGTVTIYQATRQ
jgi:hypothetical protein